MRPPRRTHGNLAIPTNSDAHNNMAPMRTTGRDLASATSRPTHAHPHADVSRIIPTRNQPPMPHPCTYRKHDRINNAAHHRPRLTIRRPSQTPDIGPVGTHRDASARRTRGTRAIPAPRAMHHNIAPMPTTGCDLASPTSRTNTHLSPCGRFTKRPYTNTTADTVSVYPPQTRPRQQRRTP